jgi:hypothetical protein
MSSYFEAKGISFEQVKKDIADGKIKGIKLDNKNENNTKDEACIKQGKNFLWIMQPCVFKKGCGLKRYGGNSSEEAISILESFYNVPFRYEEDLQICHIG